MKNSEENKLSYIDFQKFYDRFWIRFYGKETKWQNIQIAKAKRSASIGGQY